MEVPLYLTVFSCCLQNPLFKFCHFYYNMSWYGSLWFCLVWSCLCASCTWISVFFLRFGMFLAIISSDTFLFSFSVSLPSGIPFMCRLECFILAHRSVILLYFYFFLLAFCLLFYFHHSIFQITYSFFCIIHSALHCLQLSLELNK